MLPHPHSARGTGAQQTLLSVDEEVQHIFGGFVARDGDARARRCVVTAVSSPLSRNE